MIGGLSLRLRRIYTPQLDARVSFDVVLTADTYIDDFIEVLKNSSAISPELIEWTKVEMKSGFWVCKREYILDVFNYLSKVYRDYSVSIGLYNEVSIQVSYTESILYNFVKKEFIFKTENKKDIFDKNGLVQDEVQAYIDEIIEELDMFRVTIN